PLQLPHLLPEQRHHPADPLREPLAVALQHRVEVGEEPLGPVHAQVSGWVGAAITKPPVCKLGHTGGWLPAPKVRASSSAIPNLRQSYNRHRRALGKRPIPLLTEATAWVRMLANRRLRELPDNAPEARNAVEREN